MARDTLDRVPGLGLFLRRLRRRIQRHIHGATRIGNIAMLHAGRCGSSVLADLVKQRADVRWVGEPFENMAPYYYRMNPERRAEERIADAMHRESCTYFGFDSKYLPEQHLHRDLANKSPAQYVQLLERLGFTHYILLDRRNHLRRAVSIAIGTQTRLWNSTEPPQSTTTIRLDPARFSSYGRQMTLLDFFRTLEERHATFRNLLAGKRLLELTYEEDVEPAPSIGYRRICTFLGVDPMAVSVRLRKLNPEPLAQLVENFDDVRRALAGTRYAWMLSA